MYIIYEELELVDFYVRVFEDGIDTRDVMAKYYEAKDKIQELETKTLKYERQIKNAKKKVGKLSEKIVFQQDEIIKPLLTEVKIRDEIVSRLKNVY